MNMFERIILILCLGCCGLSAYYSYKDYKENHAMHLLQMGAYETKEIMHEYFGDLEKAKENIEYNNIEDYNE